MSRYRRRRRVNATGRDDLESRFIQIPHWVLEKDAFRLASPHAIKLLLYLLKCHTGTNNGKIPFGVRSGCYQWDRGKRKNANLDIGMSRAKRADALIELEFLGLVACEKESRFERDTDFTTGQRQVREWRLTWLPARGKTATKEFASMTAEKIEMFNSERKNRNCVRAGRLSDKLQSARSDSILCRKRGNGAYSPSVRTDTSDHSPHG